MALKSITLLIMAGNWDSAHEGGQSTDSQQLVQRGFCGFLVTVMTREEEMITSRAFQVLKMTSSIGIMIDRSQMSCLPREECSKFSIPAACLCGSHITRANIWFLILYFGDKVFMLGLASQLQVFLDDDQDLLQFWLQNWNLALELKPNNGTA